LLRDILRGSDPQITAVMDLLVQANADVVLLQGFDYDLENRALSAFADALKANGFPTRIYMQRRPMLASEPGWI